jgi:diguanylate cyclase (GGDEF)-like protein
VSIVGYVNDLHITFPLPYCMLVALGATFFWLRLHHFIAGLIGCFLPPMCLVMMTSQPALETSFAIQLSASALVSSIGIYHLVQKTNMRMFRMAAELERRATYDALTGVLNRETWVDRAGQRLIADQRQGRPTACLFLDMDRFKHINDTLGHEEGDGVLQQVAEILIRLASADDLVGRVGGDEFVVLLPSTGMRQADDMAGRILTILQSRHHRAGRLIASIGVASSLGSDTVAQLVNRADLAMLDVKERHRQLRAVESGPGQTERHVQPTARAVHQSTG